MAALLTRLTLPGKSGQSQRVDNLGECSHDSKTPQDLHLLWVVDRHPVHLQAAVKAWLEEHCQQIELFYLPSYCPELNPVEYLNGDVKQGLYEKPPSRDAGELKQRLTSQLRKLQKLPARIRKYFEHPSIAYAAL